jgi:4-hydroxybenzoate polyprenyltransferase
MLYLKLLRIKHWVKNLFLFIPLFFSGSFLDLSNLMILFAGFISFSLVASGVYVLNDYRDIDADKKHPEKCLRPLACGLVSRKKAIIIMTLCFFSGMGLALMLELKFAFILFLYLAINIAYSSGLKHISILDVMLVSVGFVLRIRAGGALADVHVSIWLTVMVYLLALFMAFAKRRDDVLLKLQSGVDMRKASSQYNLDFLNAVIVMISSITIVAYILYSVSTDTMERLGTYRIYHTSIFVIAGMLRYLQLVFVEKISGSPTNLLYQDKFIQIAISLWIISFYVILYLPDWQIF